MVIVWLKRDLRLLDHLPLVKAIQSKERIVLLYCFEPLWVSDSHYSNKHINFIKQSLADLQNQLTSHDTKILIVQEEFFGLLEKLQKVEPINAIYSYQETGMQITFDRDLALARWCKEHNVNWDESIQNGVFRGRSDRKKWKNDWVKFINEPIPKTEMHKGIFYTHSAVQNILEPLFRKVSLKTPINKNIQYGGTSTAKKYLDSFLIKRIEGYNKNYSKPATSRKHSSRLSPYLAWGNLSTRQVCQYAAAHKKGIGNKRNLSAFLSRMRWQAHFIQKFEMEIAMEFQSVNTGYHQLVKEKKPHLQKAWREGQTGIPLVDAAMRCLVTTGFVNFRLRAMLASFFTHLLWQPWQDCTEHLAQNFLDFEPGIHFPQLNMQSGETGINTIRIYNPVKNSKEHDTDGVFIKKWLPELANLPRQYIHDPWNIPAMELQFLGFKLGIDYPYPIVDINRMRVFASDTLYEYKKRANVKEEGQRIVKKHTIPGRPIWNKTDTIS